MGLLLTLITCNIHTLHSLVTILGTWVILSLSPRYGRSQDTWVLSPALGEEWGLLGRVCVCGGELWRDGGAWS